MFSLNICKFMEPHFLSYIFQKAQVTSNKMKQRLCFYIFELESPKIPIYLPQNVTMFTLLHLPRWFSAFSSFEEDTGNLWLDCYGARIKWSSKFKICLFPPSWQIVCRFRTAVSLYFTTYQEKRSLLVLVNKNLETSRQMKNKLLKA